MKRTYIGTIGETKFTRPQVAKIKEAVGLIIDKDLGKKVYEMSDDTDFTFYQLENEEQRAKRLSDEAEEQ